MFFAQIRHLHSQEVGRQSSVAWAIGAAGGNGRCRDAASADVVMRGALQDGLRKGRIITAIWRKCHVLLCVFFLLGAED